MGVRTRCGIAMILQTTGMSELVINLVSLTFCRAKRARVRLQDHTPATASPMPIRTSDQRRPKTSDIPDATTRPMKSLRFFADRAAKKWPLRGSLKLR